MILGITSLVKLMMESNILTLISKVELLGLGRYDYEFVLRYDQACIVGINGSCKLTGNHSCVMFV